MHKYMNNKVENMSTRIELEIRFGRHFAFHALKYSYIYMQDYTLQLVAAAAVPLVALGMGTFPPGESANLAVRTSTPSSVTSRVCSNCAVLLPSVVTLVQSSGQVLSLCVPRVIMGSMVKHMPGFASPTALFLA